MKATDYFSSARKLGGRSFQGTLAGKSVAVVVENQVCLDVDFIAEVQNHLYLHHSILVRVLGGCLSGDHCTLFRPITGGICAIAADTMSRVQTLNVDASWL